jgi:hypothetical protein
MGATRNGSDQLEVIDVLAGGEADRPRRDRQGETVNEVGPDLQPGGPESSCPSAPGHPRGRPSTRSATMLRWISDVPPAMVPEKERRYCEAQAPS